MKTYLWLINPLLLSVLCLIIALGCSSNKGAQTQNVNAYSLDKPGNRLSPVKENQPVQNKQDQMTKNREAYYQHKSTSNPNSQNESSQSKIYKEYPATLYFWHKAKMIGDKIPVYINDVFVGTIVPDTKLTYKQFRMGKIKITVKNTEIPGHSGEKLHDVDFYLTVTPNDSYYLRLYPRDGHNCYFENLKKTDGKKEFEGKKTKNLVFEEEEIIQPNVVPIIIQPNDAYLPAEAYLKTRKDSIPIKLSDIDKNIPVDDIKYEHRYALIFGNEDYSTYQESLGSESNVDFARQDAKTFAKYCESIFGIPEDNIFLSCDATGYKMKQQIDKLVQIIQWTKGEAEVFFYFAGHGYPDIETRESYIMPVDISGNNPRDGIKLADLYQKLSLYPAKCITVILDACFSGGGRNAGLLAARAVRIKPVSDTPTGNIVIFSSTSGEMLSLPYKEKYHGIFTYYFLKKIQATKGNVSYSELWDYLIDEIPLQSVKCNNKVQIPEIIISPDMEYKWQDMYIK